jgi:hypothetical protein
MPTRNVRDRSSRADYPVGYGKPPLHTRFAKGKSGNPGGRPRGATSLVRAKALALEEAYRLGIVKEGRKEVALPAIQAILRRQIALAAQGNGPAQRAVIATVLAIEEEEAQFEAERRAREAEANKPTDLIDAARRVCYLLNIARDEEDMISGRTRPQADAHAAPATSAAGVAGAAAVPTAATPAGTPSAGTPCASAPSAGASPAGPAPAGTPSAGDSSQEMPPAGASVGATTPAVASSAGLSSVTACSTDPPHTAVPSPGASSVGAPSHGASAAGTSSAGAPFARPSSPSTVPADVPNAGAPRRRAYAARPASAGAASAGAASAGAPSPERPPPQKPVATAPRCAWRERTSPEAMLWRGKSPARASHPIRNGASPDWCLGHDNARPPDFCDFPLKFPVLRELCGLQKSSDKVALPSSKLFEFRNRSAKPTTPQNISILGFPRRRHCGAGRSK